MSKNERACPHTYIPILLNCIIIAMYYLYILKSEKNGSLYIGQTNNLKRRLFEHNNGKSEYTNKYRPYILKYYEAYVNEEEAIKRERSLKLDGRALSILKKRISKSLQ